MQMRLVSGLQNLVERLTWGEQPGSRHQNSRVYGLVENLEHSIVFGFQYVNLCKLG